MKIYLKVESKNLAKFRSKNDASGASREIGTGVVNRTPIIRMGPLRGPGPLGTSQVGANLPPTLGDIYTTKLPVQSVFWLMEAILATNSRPIVNGCLGRIREAYTHFTWS